MSPQPPGSHRRHRVVMIGAGFGGLAVVKGLRDQPVDVVLVDAHNFHTFQPLLYQVATAGLDVDDVAYAIDLARGRARIDEQRATGELGDDVDAVDALMACFPGGSVTGAPKIEAMKTIANLEPHPRGPYCGSMGYLSCSGDADFNILIRTITATEGKLQIPVGGGITARSQPAAEEAETWAKARGMLNALPGENVSENNLPDTNAPAPKENKTAMSPVPRDKISGLA